jgi:hypothetical protein
MKKVYLSGPMENVCDENARLFKIAEDYFNAQNCIVYNPVKLSIDLKIKWSTYNQEPSYSDFLANDLKVISEANIDTLVLLPAWYTSRGCRLELAFATIAKLYIIEWMPENIIDCTVLTDNQRHKAAHIAWFNTLLNHNKKHPKIDLIAEMQRTEAKIKDYSILIDREQLTNK